MIHVRFDGFTSKNITEATRGIQRERGTFNGPVAINPVIITLGAVLAHYFPGNIYDPISFLPSHG